MSEAAKKDHGAKDAAKDAAKDTKNKAHANSPGTDVRRLGTTPQSSPPLGEELRIGRNAEERVGALVVLPR